MKAVKKNCEDNNVFFISFNCVLFLSFLLVSNVFAAPSFSNFSGSFSNGSNFTVTGSAFGAKAQAAPVYWSNLEDGIIGQAPVGWTHGRMSNNEDYGRVSTADKYSGNNSLHFAMKTANYNPGWSELKRDIGASPRWYFYLKNKFIKNDSNTGFQWKSWRISSSPDGYVANSEPSTVVMYNDWWWRTSGWYNQATFSLWNIDGFPGTAANNYVGKINSGYSFANMAYSDSILFNQWQTFEQFEKMSSTTTSPFDGISQVWRDGRLIIGKTGIQTHVSWSGVWRYFLLGQNTGTGAQPVDGNTDCDIFYDDIYIDNTQARVMLGDHKTFAASTHREIQPATVWNDGSITFTVNLGSFTNEKVYLYVIDENGNVNPEGYLLKIGGKYPAPDSVQKFQKEP